MAHLARHILTITTTHVLLCGTRPNSTQDKGSSNSTGRRSDSHRPVSHVTEPKHTNSNLSLASNYNVHAQWRIVGSRGPGARTSVGPSAMVRPNVYQLRGTGSPPAGSGPGRVILFPINAPGVGRFQLLNLGFFGYVLELRFWVVIAIIVSLTLTITLITTLTILSLFLVSLCQGWGAACNFFTASSDSLFHPPLSLVFFFQSSSSPAFLTSLLTQSSHLSLGLPRLLLPLSNPNPQIKL